MINLYQFIQKPLTPLILSITLASILATTSGCSSEPTMADHSTSLSSALSTLSDQKSDTVEAYREADNARKSAMEQEPFSYKSENTKSFISEWSNAELKVQALRDAYNEVIKTADHFFTFCESKASTINNKSLRVQVFSKIDTKKSAFTSSVKKTHDAISALEKSIVAGNDIIKSLEIVGALTEIGDQRAEMNRLFSEANEMVPIIDQLLNEGNLVLQLELDALD